MASIGDISATLRADTAQFTQGMAQAAQSVNGVAVSTEKAGNAVVSLEAQLATAEGRLGQLRGAFASLGIPAAGKEFQDVTARVAALRAQLGRAQTDLARTGNAAQSAAGPLANAGAASGQMAQGLNKIRGPLTSVATGLAGLPGPVGNLASKLLGFAVGGGVTVAVTAGLAAVALAFTKLREKAVAESKRVEESVAGLVQSYQERTGAVVRRGVEDARDQLAQAQRELEAAQRGTTVAASRGSARPTQTIVDPAAVRAAEAEVVRLSQALDEANRQLTEFNTPHAERAEALAAQMRTLAEQTFAANEAFEVLQRNVAATGLGGGATLVTPEMLARVQESLAAMQEQTDLIREQVGLSDAQVEALVRESNQRLVNLGLLDDAREMQKRMDSAKADTSVKDQIADSARQAQEAAQSAGESIARAIGQGFQGEGKNLQERIFNVLAQALREAMTRLLAAKITEGLLALLTGGASKTSVGAEILGHIPVIGSFFGSPTAPTMPSVAMPSPQGNATIVVPFDAIPPALSPVEHARDVQWQTLFMETARVSEANGFRLAVRRG